MKIALFAFNGDPMCFIHVLLNAFDLRSKGHQAAIVLEGSASGLVKELLEEESELPFVPLLRKAQEEGLIDCICAACAMKMGSYDAAVKLGFKLCEEMQGHPSIARYMDEGYSVLTF